VLSVCCYASRQSLRINKKQKEIVVKSKFDTYNRVFKFQKITSGVRVFANSTARKSS